MPRSIAIPPRTASAPRLGRTSAFWVLAVTLGLLLLASSAPSPLYVVYQAKWGFSEIALTSVFAIYALALLGTLVIAGSVSDRVGRRATLLVALAIEIAAMALFAQANGLALLFAARMLQGVGTALAMGAISAALLDLEPPSHPRLGALLGVAAPLSGLALGALGSGLLVQYGPDPTRLIYWLLLGVFALALLIAPAVPETVTREGRLRDSLRPRIAVPSPLRVAFIATVPCLVATWALGGLVLSLGPSLTATVLGNTSHAAGGVAIFIMAGVSAIASIRFRDAHARSTARGGLAALILGVGLVLIALSQNSIALFFVGAGIAGLGFGPAFGGAFRALSSRAPAGERAGLVSAILAVSYLAFSLPAVAAGAAVTRLGLQTTTVVYGIALIALASLALALSHRLEDPGSEASARAEMVPAAGGGEA